MGGTYIHYRSIYQSALLVSVELDDSLLGNSLAPHLHLYIAALGWTTLLSSSPGIILYERSSGSDSTPCGVSPFLAFCNNYDLSLQHAVSKLSQR